MGSTIKKAIKRRIDTILRANEAWKMVERKEDPMPVLVAADWLQEEDGDRARVLDVILVAASDYLYGIEEKRDYNQRGDATLRQAREYARQARYHLEFGNLGNVGDYLGYIIENCGNATEARAWNHLTPEQSDSYFRWERWCDEARRVLALCEPIVGDPGFVYGG